MGVDSTTLEANAAMRAIVRRGDGTEYAECLQQLAVASGIETPTREDLADPEEGLEQGLDAPARPGGADHEDDKVLGAGPPTWRACRDGDEVGNRCDRCHRCDHCRDRE